MCNISDASNDRLQGHRLASRSVQDACRATLEQRTRASNMCVQMCLCNKTQLTSSIWLSRRALPLRFWCSVMQWEFTVVPSSWVIGDVFPNNELWRPLPPLQVDRVNANQNKIWWGDLRRGSFKAWEKSTEHDEFSVWKARDGLQMLTRSSTSAIMMLRAACGIKQDQLLITGRSMAGNVMYSGTFPASTRLTMKTVTKDAVSSLQRRNLLRSAQKLQWTSAKGALVPDHLVYKPSSVASLYQNYKRRRNGKTDMRVKALKL